MNNNNIVKIGTALKWRNTFDITKKYYQENVVTVCGCVFRCKVLQAQGKTPVRIADDAGHLAFANTDVWDVIVDMVYYYNFAIDTNNLTKETLEYIKKLDAEWQKQQKEIEAIQKDNKKQWERIIEIEKLNAEQQREINSVLDTYSCFSEGIWFDTLLWNNDLLWNNNKYAITDDLQNQIDKLSNRHKEDIKQINSDIEEVNTHMAQHEEEQRQINNYLLEQNDNWNNSISCFSEGVWENLLHWGNLSLWDNNKFSITENLQSQIDEIIEEHNNDTKNIINRFEENESLINEHDTQLVDLLERFCCFSNGQWDNELKWNNATVWENSNMMCNTFKNVFNKIDEHDTSIANLIDEHEIIYKSIDRLEEDIANNKTANKEQQKQIDDLLRIHSVINNGFWDNSLLWTNESEWTNRTPVDQLIEVVVQNTNDIAQNKKELDDLNADAEELEKSVARSENNIKTINTQLEEISKGQTVQNEKIAQIGSHFCCFTDGIWGDWFLWHNDDIWANNVNNHESRISEMEMQFASMMNTLVIQQKQLTEQMEELDRQKALLNTIMVCLSVISVGTWNNDLLWYNEARWSNGNFSENENDKLTIQSYDKNSGTIILNPVAYYYNEMEQSLEFKDVGYSYDKPTETLDFDVLSKP